MEQPPYDIFPKLLAPNGRGYALWDPAHGDQLPAEIADVGYIEKGSFIRLFNASVGPDHALNNLGVPNGYHPLHVGTVCGGKSSHTVCMSEKMKCSSARDCSSKAGDFEFICRKGQGAVMVLGDYVEKQDALDKNYFLQYILENYRAWLEFANEVHGRRITVNDLVLVTGWDKSSAWACTTLSGGRKAAAFLKISAGENAPLDTSRVWAKWIPRHSVEAISGPVFSSNPDQKDPPSQCVFLRGIRLVDRNTLTLKQPPKDGFKYVRLNEIPDRSGSGGSRSKRKVLQAAVRDTYKGASIKDVMHWIPEHKEGQP